MKTTDGRLCLIAEDTLERMDIQFMPPKHTETTTANLAEVRIAARNLPRFQHVGVSNRLEFTLDFYSNELGSKDVLRKVRWLQSLCYNNKGLSKTQRVIVIFGDMYRNQTWRVVRVSPDFSLYDKQGGYLPKRADVQLDLEQDNEFDVGWEDVQFNPLQYMP
jgi:hypothetical protein